MNYVQEARKQLVASLDDYWPENNKWERLLDLYTLLVLVKGDTVTLEDVHDAWSVWCARTRPGHRFLVPFQELPEETGLLDKPFADGIRNAARVLQGESRVRYE